MYFIERIQKTSHWKSIEDVRKTFSVTLLKKEFLKALKNSGGDWTSASRLFPKTQKENWDEDSEIALDPEMRGAAHEWNARQNKSCGVFYTPKNFVLFMFRSALNHWLAHFPKSLQLQKLRTIEILDPACGCGAFLVGGARVLLEKRRELGDETSSDEILHEIIHQNLFGWELDSNALEIARWRLNLLAKITNESSLKIKNESKIEVKSLYKNLSARDSLLELEADRFDLVVGNPPYDALQDLPKTLENAYRNTSFAAFAGLGGIEGRRPNVFQLFLPLGWEILRSGGVLSMVVPNSLLAEDSTRGLREQMIHRPQCEICSIESFPERDRPSRRVFENVKMSVCVPTLRKMESNNNQQSRPFPVRIWSDRDFSRKTMLRITPDEIETLFPHDLIFPSTSQKNLKILKKIQRMGDSDRRLEIEWHSGEIDVTKFRTEFIADSSSADSRGLRVVTGAQIQRFALTNTPTQGGVRFLPSEVLDAISATKRSFFEDETLAVQRISGANSRWRLVTALVPAGVLCANSVNRGWIQTFETDSDFVLGLLNSSVLNFYIKQTATNTNLTLSTLRTLPLPWFPPNIQRPIAEIVREIRTFGLTPANEKRLNQSVGVLYGLSPDFQDENDFRE